MALGGSSDVVGVLALVRAAGFSKCVLVQPGSQAKGMEKPESVTAQKVDVVPNKGAPGGDYFDNGAMVSYLLSLSSEGTFGELEAGYYVVQPKDDGQGFSDKSVEQTVKELKKLVHEHSCSALLGLDFGGDVALPEEATPGGPHILQRDLLKYLDLRLESQTAMTP